MGLGIDIPMLAYINRFSSFGLSLQEESRDRLTRYARPLMSHRLWYSSGSFASCKLT
jgi:hypothetical protein